MVRNALLRLKLYRDMPARDKQQGGIAIA